MVGGGDRAGEHAERAAGFIIVERPARPCAADRGIGVFAPARRVERERVAKLPARGLRRIGLEIGEGARRIIAVERDRFFGARAQLFGLGPAADRKSTRLNSSY